MNILAIIPIALRLMSLVPQLLALKDHPAIAELLKMIGELTTQVVPAPVDQPQQEPEEETVSRVRWVQEALNRLGVSPQLVVDGVYGQATKDAVRAFQTSHSLQVDGWAGTQTIEAMQRLTGR